MVRAALAGEPMDAAPAPLPPAFTLQLDAAPQVLVEGDGSPRNALVRIRAETTTRAGVVAVRIAIVALFVRAEGHYAVRAWRTDRPTLFPG